MQTVTYSVMNIKRYNEKLLVLTLPDVHVHHVSQDNMQHPAGGEAEAAQPVCDARLAS